MVQVRAPYPRGRNGEEGTNSSRRKPYDWVLVNSKLEVLAVPTVIGTSSYPSGLVFDSREYTQAELDAVLPPALVGDSSAVNMQHMAVIRDFVIPGRVDHIVVEPERLDFGTVAVASGPFDSAPVTVVTAHPLVLTEVMISGDHAEELQLLAPSLPAPLCDTTELVFRWSPATGDGVRRTLTATLVTTEPPHATVEISGLPRTEGGGGTGEPLAIAGYRIEQQGGQAALTIPAGTTLAPGGLLVIGRDASRSEFEHHWGPLAENVIYLDGSTLAGDVGFPIINGGEQYRLLDGSGVQIDPLDGRLPTPAVNAGQCYQRDSTATSSFAALVATQADPGRYTGQAAHTGILRITEIADAPGSGNYRYEFIELLYDSGE